MENEKTNETIFTEEFKKDIDDALKYYNDHIPDEILYNLKLIALHSTHLIVHNLPEDTILDKLIAIQESMYNIQCDINTIAFINGQENPEDVDSNEQK